jgi:hypothetical protein
VRALVALVFFVSSGCVVEPRTEIMVRIEGDEIIRDVTRIVEIEVYGGTRSDDIPSQHVIQIPFSIEAGLTWPITHGVIPRDNDHTRRFRIEATARNEAGEFVAHTRAISVFVRQQTRTLTLRFFAACIYNDSCVASLAEYCDENGACRTAEREPDPVDAGVIGELDAAGMDAAGRDAAGPPGDAGPGRDADVPSDAGPPCTSSSECTAGPECTIGGPRVHDRRLHGDRLPVRSAAGRERLHRRRRLLQRKRGVQRRRLRAPRRSVPRRYDVRRGCRHVHGLRRLRQLPHDDRVVRDVRADRRAMRSDGHGVRLDHSVGVHGRLVCRNERDDDRSAVRSRRYRRHPVRPRSHVSLLGDVHRRHVLRRAVRERDVHVRSDRRDGRLPVLRRRHDPTPRRVDVRGSMRRGSSATVRSWSR